MFAGAEADLEPNRVDPVREQIVAAVRLAEIHAQARKQLAHEPRLAVAERLGPAPPVRTQR